MAAHRAHGLTNGFLPTAAFRHLEPTRMTRLELGAAPTLTAATPASPDTPYRDGLVLVSLHGEPLGVAHIDADPERATLSDILEATWAQLEGSIREHCARFGCCVPPREASALQSTDVASKAPCAATRVAASDASVSIVIPTGGRVSALARCLESITQLDYAAFDVLVVDNRPSVPGTRAVVNALSDRLAIRYVAEARQGSSVARNRGIAESTSELIAFTDDDVVLDPGWLRWLVDPFAHPKVNATTGMVLPLALDTAAQKRFEQYAGFSKGVTRARYNLADTRASTRMLYPYWGGVFGSGNSMAFRRAELAEAGGMDPALGAGSPARAGADIEALSAAILRGGELVYEPRSIGWHEHRRDHSALERQLVNYGVGFAAVITKHLTRDPKFIGAAIKSLPIIIGARDHGEGTSESMLPKELAALGRRGMLSGPYRYASSYRWARSQRLYDVVRGG